MEEQEKSLREKAAYLEKKYNEELDNKYYYTEEEKEEKKELERQKEKEKAKEDLFKFLDKDPELVDEIINRYTPKEVKKENKRNFLFKKLSPAIIGLSMILGIIGGSLAKKFEMKNNNIIFSTSYEKTYDSVEDAPIEIVEEYANHEMDVYSKDLESGEIRKNTNFEDTFREFQKNLNEGNITEAKKIATTLNNMTMNDMSDSTMPFTSTIYSGGYVDENGEVVLPVTSLNDIDQDTDLSYDGSGLKRKGR